MDEYLMYEYLRNKGMGRENDREFMNKFRNFMSRYKRNYMKGGEMDSPYFMDDSQDFYNRRHRTPGDYHDNPDVNPYEFRRNNMPMYMRDSFNDNHFTESEARNVVSMMFHMEGGRKHEGEKYDLYKAKEVKDRYKGIIPSSTSIADVYVALNSHYHDYAELYKNWFGDKIDQKIIESAITFWFRDADCESENKVAEYLKMF